MVFMFDFKKRKQEARENILGIVFKEIKGKLMVFESSSQGVVLKTTKEFVYSNVLENLVEDIDQQLSILETEGYKDFSSTIYFLDETFIAEKTKEVRESFLPKLRDIEEKLSLRALGYVDINEVIINQIEKENNLPLSAIFLNIEKTHFQFILRKAGKNIFEKRIARSDNILYDFYEGIAAVKDYVPLPIRIIMFDDGDLEKEKNTLINHHFKDEYFIQPPKIEIISPILINRYLTEIIKNELLRGKKYAVDEGKEDELFGFVVGKDIKKSSIKEDILITEERKISEKNNFIDLSVVKKFFSSLIMPLKLTFYKSKLITSISNVYLVILGITLIIFSIFINEYFFHKVKIIITTKKISLQKDINLSETEIPIIIKKLNQEVTKTITTSGSKLVGNKAKGEVDLYNYSFDQTKINAGTIISSNNIKFILNEDVKIASASYIGNQVGKPLEPGKVKATITAVNIGEEGNLPKGTLFQIEGMAINQIFGKNEVDISGGSKKTVKIFSQEDKENLKKLAISEVKKSDLSAKNSLDKNLVLINDLTEIKLTEEIYSHKEEEETDKASLRARINKIYYFYNQEKLKDKLLERLKKDIPNDYSLKKESVYLTLKQVSQKDGEKDFKFNINGFYNKKIDINKLRKNLTFVNKNDLQSVIKSNDIKKYTLKEENKFFLFSNYLPFFMKNIEIVEN